MKNTIYNNSELVELSTREKKEINGGSFWVAAGGIALGGAKLLALFGIRNFTRI